MRLLRLEEEGELSILEFSGSYAPPYAILAHVQGSEEEEISFQDVTKGRYKEKPAYRKLLFCGRQAALGGFNYFWVDTCCFQKPNSSESSAIIHSITDFFKRSSKCYVFLADFVLGDQVEEKNLPSRREYGLESSKFFKHCWSLTQILAPQSVQFYSYDGKDLGDRLFLKSSISKVTGLPAKALEGYPLSQFSVEERISWISRLEGTREEDIVYCSIGLFDVQMPLLYGEGCEKASTRLRERLETKTTSDTQAPTARLYRRLNSDRLRIFILDPGHPGSSITGHLEDFDMIKHPAFNAVSYVWGQEPPVHHIRINNCPVSIRPNLFHALQRMRNPDSHICLWVDSLCINQSDIFERTAQVKKMADIYHAAENVWIWLGEHDLTSKHAMSFIPQISSNNQHQRQSTKDSLYPMPLAPRSTQPPPIPANIYGQKSHYPHSSARLPTAVPWWKRYDYTAFEELMGRPWFRRRWVIQEAAFSKKSFVFCGDRHILLDDLTRAAALVRRDLDSLTDTSYGSETKAQLSTILPNFQDSPATRLLDILNTVFRRSQDGSILERTLPLEALVELATFCETTDPRDTIFALLGLANDVSSRRVSEEYMVPEYRDTPLTVFTNFILHCYRQSGSLDIICRPWAPVLTQNESNTPNSTTYGDDFPPESTSESKLPSWIVSRSRLPFGDPSKQSFQRLNGKPLVGSCRKQVYNANCGLKAKVYNQDTFAQRACLKVGGIILGEIEALSPRMADGIVPKDCLLLLQELIDGEEGVIFPDSVWRILCADRDNKGNPAPSSWSRQLFYVWDLLTQGKLREFENGTDTIDIEELLECSLGEECDEFLKTVRDVVWNRRTFRGHTSAAPHTKLIGLVPRRTRTHDYICILYGCSVPVVMRKFDAEPNNSRHWILIGEAYVHGFMNGEGISRLPQGVLFEWQEAFEIR